MLALPAFPKTGTVIQRNKERLKGIPLLKHILLVIRSVDFDEYSLQILSNSSHLVASYGYLKSYSACVLWSESGGEKIEH